jgi:hypothetical protein
VLVVDSRALEIELFGDRLSQVVPLAEAAITIPPSPFTHTDPGWFIGFLLHISTLNAFYANPLFFPIVHGLHVLAFLADGRESILYPVLARFIFVDFDFFFRGQHAPA